MRAFPHLPCLGLILLLSVLLRRFWFPLPPSSRSCRCSRLLDVFGHHRAGCAEAGVLGRRGFPLESAVARWCREAVATVTTNVMIRDLDLLPMNHVDARQLVVAVGLPLFMALRMLWTQLLSHS